MQKKFSIEVDCANCAAKIENAVKQLPGVKNVSVSFMAQKMLLEAEDAQFEVTLVRIGDLIEVVGHAVRIGGRQVRELRILGGRALNITCGCDGGEHPVRRGTRGNLRDPLRGR